MYARLRFANRSFRQSLITFLVINISDGRFESVI